MACMKKVRNDYLSRKEKKNQETPTTINNGSPVKLDAPSSVLLAAF